MKVFNLTKHQMTSDQVANGGLNVPAAQAATELHDFVVMPTAADMQLRAAALMSLAQADGAVAGDGVMLAGPMYFIPPLVDAARDAGFVPTFSFTQRVAVEKPLDDGSVKLEYIFRHEGWMTV